MAVRVSACSVMPRAREIAVAWRESSVDVPEHDVDRADHRHHVSDQLAPDHVGERAEIAERWGANLASVRPVGPVTRQVEPQLAARRLNRLVDLTGGDAHPLGHKLEMMD